MLSPRCFLQGSYRQSTAIYTINDIDIIALCALWQPGSSGGGRSYGRDEIFDIIAAPFLADGRYAHKVHYGPTSMCIKVDLGIKIELLPVVYKQGNNDAAAEPFRLYRPERSTWDDGYARYHQQHLTLKNQATGGNFIPMIKVMKHLRSRAELDAVSFHIECLLWNVPNDQFAGGPADYIPAVLRYITGYDAAVWRNAEVRTPCQERLLFSETEWTELSWILFHLRASSWATFAETAAAQMDIDNAIDGWKVLLGDDLFPRHPS